MSRGGRKAGDTPTSEDAFSRAPLCPYPSHSSVVRQPLRCRSGLSVGRSTSGQTATLVPSKVVFCPQAHAGHFGRLVGTATPLRGHRRPGPVRASAHLSRVLVGAGVTPAVHSHGSAPSAPVVAGDREGAHGRVYSDRAVDRPSSRLIRPQGPHPRTAAWRACPRRSHSVRCCWLTDTQWTASSTAGRFRRLGGSVKATSTGKYVPNARQSKRAAHTPPTGPVCVLLYCPHTC